MEAYFIILLFQNNCYLALTDNLQLNTDCSAWKINDDNSLLESGISYKRNAKYYAELYLMVDLIKAGNVYNIYFILI